MLTDRQEGRLLEWDICNGVVSRLGRRHGIETPVSDVLVPLFERQTGLTVKTVSVGTGQALALAARGEADVTLCHAPALEKKYVAEGRLQTS